VNFTGSTKVGRLIGALAGKHLKACLLELGGKSPLVILDDADLGLAVNAAAFGAFMNHGQICMSTERIIVDERTADPFVVALSDKAKALSLEGGLVSCSSAEQVEALIENAVQQGAELLLPFRRHGAKVDPIVLDKVRPGMMVYGDESFGPIAAIVRVRGVDEAVRVANDTQYGLAGAVFGREHRPHPGSCAAHRMRRVPHQRPYRQK
jgi:acyl-CoA reductase-like NAD-dependent aldehyde dehydrogenase